MKRILFVDDEANVLAGLRDMLRRQRSRWDMVFVSSGAAALEELERRHFDVIVSDMRMPGMDGAELLREVRARHPGVARLILSGQADREAILRALPVTQQFLGKPCTPEALREVVDRVCSLQSLLRDDGMRAVVGSLERIPPLPQTWNQLTASIGRADVTTEELAAIVERDPALTVKVLQLVNSAWFGASRRTSSIEVAISYLGVELLRSLALVAEVFAALDRAPAGDRSLAGLQARSVAAARLVKRLLEGDVRASQGFTAGLLHEIGLIVLSLGACQRLDDVGAEVRRGGRPFHEVEKQLLGVTHAEVGAYLLGVWGLPFDVVEAVAWHHSPERAPASGDVRLVGAVYLAAQLVEAVDAGRSPSEIELHRPLLERAGLADRVAESGELAVEAVAAVAREARA